MKNNIAILFLMALFLALLSCTSPGDSSHRLVIPPDKDLPPDIARIVYDDSMAISTNLQTGIDVSDDGDTLILQAGLYYADRQPFVDSLCGNCLEHKTHVAASVGFTLRGKSLTIIGNGPATTVLITGAGYGFYFENSPKSYLRNLKITGGLRDPDGNATDAGIVVRTSRVYIEGCSISDNTHRRDSVVVGIGGIFGREGAEIYMSQCDIINNGWDGIALYRGASAVITDCVIKKGRGAGIGVTWDAHCLAKRNRISEYWKGIGAFGTSTVIAHNNAVFDNLGWGIIGTGKSFLDATNNVVYHNGNCGVAPWSQECRGKFVNNIIAENGWREPWVCPCVGIWNYGDLEKWDFLHNLIWNNDSGAVRDMPNIIGQSGNISADPMFVGDGDFRLKPGSPALDAGWEEITDHDGTISDMGIYGGTAAKF